MNEDVYNNQVTYHPKWKTPENEAAAGAAVKIALKLGAEAFCDCPPAWGPEVLRLMEWIQEQHGQELTIRQLKEKFGKLCVYFEFPRDMSEVERRVRAHCINEQIQATEILLSLKGVYWSLEELKKWTVCWTTPKSKEEHVVFPYRNILYKFFPDDEETPL